MWGQVDEGGISMPMVGCMHAISRTIFALLLYPQLYQPHNNNHTIYLRKKKQRLILKFISSTKYQLPK